MRLPRPRGALSEALIDRLPGSCSSGTEDLLARAACAVDAASDVLDDEDVQLSLTVLYELHYQGFDDVDEGWEWQPGLLAARAVLEQSLEEALRAAVTMPALPPPSGAAVARALFGLTNTVGGPDLSGFVAQHATVGQVREMLVHRSIYQLKEADTHTWAIPRLAGRAKAALVEIQSDEYGGGRPDRMHSALFGSTMTALGLDPTPGTYLDSVPAVVLVEVNAQHLFGLHRRLRGAVVGHLCAVEMTSSLPCRKYGKGLRRLGFGAEATRFYDEHIEADAVHEQIAAHDMAGALAEAEPTVLGDIMFGAAVFLELGNRSADYLLDCWQGGRSSLLEQKLSTVNGAG